MTMIKLPYEPPVIIDLSGGEAFAADISSSAKQCKAGAAAQEGTVCTTGGSPRYDCNAGATASGSKCMSGSVAGAQCIAGSAAEANQCNPGAVATTQCKVGSVAGGTCKAGSAVAG